MHYSSSDRKSPGILLNFFFRGNYACYTLVIYCVNKIWYGLKVAVVLISTDEQLAWKVSNIYEILVEQNYICSMQYLSTKFIWSFGVWQVHYDNIVSTLNSWYKYNVLIYYLIVSPHSLHKNWNKNFNRANCRNNRNECEKCTLTAARMVVVSPGLHGHFHQIIWIVLARRKNLQNKSKLQFTQSDPHHKYREFS